MDLKIRRVLLVAVTGILALTLSRPAFSESNLVVHFEAGTLSDTASFPAAAKLSFRPTDAGRLKYPPTWQKVEEAALLGNPAFDQISLVRYEASDHAVGYAIDSNGIVADSGGAVISFHEYSDRKVANVTIPIRRRSLKTDSDHLSYQIILDTQGVSARPAECRNGKAIIGDHGIPMRLILTSINTPYYSLTGGTACLADSDGSGSYSPMWEISPAGKVIPSERIPFSTPTVLAGEKFRAATLDSIGENLTFEKYDGDTALAVGYISPDWSVTDISGRQHTLKSAAGKVTLMLFWSTTCPFCEKIRPALNGLFTDNDSTLFQVVACCLEGDTAQIHEYLATEPYEGIIVPYDSVMWQRFNHRMSTPAICLIGRDGTIRFAGTGVSMFEVAEKIVQNLLETR